MQAGKLNRRINILRATTTKNSLNEDIETWAVLVKRWCEVEHVSDGERTRAAEVGATISMRFRIRYDSVTATITPKDRIEYPVDGRQFNIVAVKEIQNHVGLEISAVARAE